MGMTELFTTSLIEFFSSKSKFNNEIKAKEHADLLEARKKYRKAVTEIRFGDFDDLAIMISTVNNYINNNGGDNFDKSQASLIKELLGKLYLPNEKYHPYELPILFDFKLLCDRIDKIINQ